MVRPRKRAKHYPELLDQAQEDAELQRGDQIPQDSGKHQAVVEIKCVATLQDCQCTIGVIEGLPWTATSILTVMKVIVQLTSKWEQKRGFIGVILRKKTQIWPIRR